MRAALVPLALAMTAWLPIAAAAQVRLPDAIISRPYALVLPLRGGEGELRWSLNGSLPPGLDFLERGAVKGTPTELGDFEFSVTIEDQLGQRVGPVAHAIRVVRPSTTPLAIGFGALSKGYEGLPYAFHLYAEGGSPPYVWEIAEGDLPDGLDVDANVLAGVPKKRGRFALRIGVRDARGDTAARDEELRIEAGERSIPELAGIALPSAFVGVPYAFTVPARGGLPPRRLDVVEGDLPGWISLEGLVLAGRPAAPGRTSFRARVIDSLGIAGEPVQLTLEVALPPFVSPLQIRGENLPDAQAGVAYASVVPVDGGVPPYRFEAQRAGSALTLERGVIRGTPERPGAWSWEGQVVDALGTRVPVTLEVQIRLRPSSPPGAESVAPEGRSLRSIALAAGWTGAALAIGALAGWRAQRRRLAKSAPGRPLV